ncbi:MAG: YigZ family protein [Longimicrobiales bacterium]|nr:YigZ family protein [Longimicrobiales bacterium]
MTDPGRFPIPARVHRVEQVIQRSRFITTVAHAPDPEAAHAFVARMRDEFPDATHNCWAFVAGPPGSTTRIGMSDDGEPHGTAGRPMLTSLVHSGVGEIVAVSTRYYGGVKLGTGGLSRAYSGGVVLALAEMPREEKVDRRGVRLTVGYPDIDSIQRLVSEREWILLDESFGSDVSLELLIPSSEIEDARTLVADRTRGSGVLEEDAVPPDS